MSKMPIDYSKYPPHWKSEIVPAILARADNACEWCGIPNYCLGYRMGKYWIELQECATYAFAKDLLHERYSSEGDQGEVIIVLTVAHLDHDPENFNVDHKRLMALCQLCHLTYDRLHREGQELKKQPALKLYDST